MYSTYATAQQYCQGEVRVQYVHQYYSTPFSTILMRCEEAALQVALHAELGGYSTATPITSGLNVATIRAETIDCP